MNKLISYILITALLLPGMAQAQQSSSPTIGDLIGNILAGDNSYKAYLHVSENEKATCTDCTEKGQAFDKTLSKKSFYDSWKLNCHALNGSDLCKGIKEEDKLLCNEPPKQAWYSHMWEKTVSCGAGIKRSWQDFFHFIQQIGNYIVNKDNVRTKTNQQISKAWNSMKAYMSMEMTKLQDKYNMSASKAFFAVVGKMMKQFTDGLNAIIAKFAPKVGCYNYKAKTRVICQVLAEFFADPILMFKFIKLGPKVLKGTRVARFFDYHKAKAVEKVVTATKKATNLGSKGLLKIDFIGPETKLFSKVKEHRELNNAIASNKKVFEEIFPDKQAMDELHSYLEVVSPKEKDELADLIKVLGEEKNLSPREYKEAIEELKKAIKQSCEL